MEVKEFWKLIDEARLASSGDHHKQAELLVAKLTKLTEIEILSYQEIFDDLQDEAYVAELWEVAYILDMGCGDDGFMDFRAWLIGQGKDVYDKALTNPESLVDFVEPGQETKSESLLYVAQRAYELRTGKSAETMPRRRKLKPKPELKGTHSKSEDAILERFPTATAKFWNYWLDNMDKLFQS